MCYQITLDIRRVKDYFRDMRSMLEWCGVCLQDDLKVVASQVIEQVPLCKGCVVAYGQEKDVLRDARQYLKDLDEPKPTKGYVVFDPTEPQAPPVKHLCVCGCGNEVPEGIRLVAGHIDATVAPAPPSNRREPDKPLTKEERATLLGTPVVSKPKESTCLNCGNSFAVGKNSAGRYCTRECYNAKQREIEKPVNNKALSKVCKCGCGQTFAPTGNAQKFIDGHNSGSTIIRRGQEVAVPEQETKIVRRTNRKEISIEAVETQEVEHWTAGSERVSRLTVQLPSGGRLTLECEVHLFDISKEDRNFIFHISDRMRSYAKQKFVPLPPKDFTIVSGMEGGFMSDMFDCLDQEEQNRVVDWLKDAVKVVDQRRK